MTIINWKLNLQLSYVILDTAQVLLWNFPSLGVQSLDQQAPTNNNKKKFIHVKSFK